MARKTVDGATGCQRYQVMLDSSTVAAAKALAGTPEEPGELSLGLRMLAANNMHHGPVVIQGISWQGNGMVGRTRLVVSVTPFQCSTPTIVAIGIGDKITLK